VASRNDRGVGRRRRPTPLSLRFAFTEKSQAEAIDLTVTGGSIEPAIDDDG
jgi:hypothetical protein